MLVYKEAKWFTIIFHFEAQHSKRNKSLISPLYVFIKVCIDAWSENNVGSRLS